MALPPTVKTVGFRAAILYDMAENGWEFRPSLSEDQMFWALRLASVAEPEIPLDEKKIIAALERLYRDYLIQTNGEGEPISKENSAA